jgi:hypothetical protein
MAAMFTGAGGTLMWDFEAIDNFRIFQEKQRCFSGKQPPIYNRTWLQFQVISFIL